MLARETGVKRFRNRLQVAALRFATIPERPDKLKPERGRARDALLMDTSGVGGRQRALEPVQILLPDAVAKIEGQPPGDLNAMSNR